MTASEAGQSRLKNKLAEITSLLPTGAPVAYLDYPVHENFGDLLIFLGTRSFLRDYGYDIEISKSRYFLPKKISSDAVVLLHGGGNFGDLYPLHQNFREGAIARFRNHRVIILPQTIHFQQETRLERSRQVFESHPDLHLIVRDSHSFELAKQYFPSCNLQMLPDMAHHLWPGPSNKEKQDEKNGQPIFLMRDDREIGPTYAELDGYAGQFRDWADCYTARETRQLKLGIFLHRVDAKIKSVLPVTAWWHGLCDRLYRRLSQDFSGPEPLITSRMHGAIFGTLLGKTVGLLDNSYGKNRRYYDTWADDLDGVEFIDSPDILHKLLV